MAASVTMYDVLREIVLHMLIASYHVEMTRGSILSKTDSNS